MKNYTTPASLVEEVLERAAYFLERLILVAQEYKIHMASHLNDPPAPVLNA